MDIRAGDQKPSPAIKTNARAINATPLMVKQVFIMSLACFPAPGKKRIREKSSPMVESVASKVIAAIAAEAIPTASVEYSLAAAIQKKNPVACPTTLFKMR